MNFVVYESPSHYYNKKDPYFSKTMVYTMEYRCGFVMKKNPKMILNITSCITIVYVVDHGQ